MNYKINMDYKINRLSSKVHGNIIYPCLNNKKKVILKFSFKVNFFFLDHSSCFLII